jgi:hypothetical protein
MIDQTSRNTVVNEIVQRRNAELHGKTEPDLNAAAQVDRQLGEQVVLGGNSQLRELDAMLAEARRLKADLDALPTSNTGPDEIDQAVDAMFEGDDVKAREMLRKAIAGADQDRSTISTNQAIDAVERNRATLDAWRQFAQKHKAIATDPVARLVADEMVFDEMRQRGLDAIPLDELAAAFDRAGNRTAEYLKSKGDVDRAENELTPERSASDVIASLRAARQGSAVAARS